MVKLRKRHLLTHAIRGRRIIAYVAGGLLVGLTAILMAKLADMAQGFYLNLVNLSPCLHWYITPIGFALIAWVTHSFFPTSGGSGIPQVIASLSIHEQKARESLVSLASALGKIVRMSLGFLIGASIGREGPSVQVGAALMHQIRFFDSKRSKDLIIAGAGAGVAAAFSTPLAGVIFAIEELSRQMSSRVSGLLIGAILVAGFTSIAVVGDYTYFGNTSHSVIWYDVLAPSIVIAILAGILGALFTTVLTGAPGFFRKIVPLKGVWAVVGFSALCGLGIAVFSEFSVDSINGTGYAIARSLVQDDHLVSPWFLFNKFCATLLSSMSGIPGGIFSPSLAIGAGLGADVQIWFTALPVGILSILGMAAFLSGVVQAPLTAVVIVLEMTHDHSLVVPLMAASLIARWVAQQLGVKGVYHQLADRYIHPKT